MRCPAVPVHTLLLLALVAPLPVAAQLPPTELEGLRYDPEFFPGTTYDAAMPTPESVLGFRPGDRAAFPHEVAEYLTALAEACGHCELREYARSHEDRPLFNFIVSSPENAARLDEIQTGMARLADPRDLDADLADSLIADLPAPAWLAYSIHGDETSGTDAALAVAYHLAAGTSSDVARLRDALVVIIDPMMNPDGRNRLLQQITEHRGTSPNVDDQSLLHGGYWPWGRGNHYLFDLNRDWILGVHPETRGRIRAAASWHPLLFVDAHEMGPQDSYLFSPAREPRNPHMPPSTERWGDVFAREQSEAFDRYGWVYYTGEWNEGWYPGYSDAWGAFRGAVGILYEQASYGEDAVRYPNGDLTTYREAVHHQAVSSLANLETLAANREERLREFVAEKRDAVSAGGPYAKRTYAVLPTGNRSRLEAFVDLMELQGFELFVTVAETEVGAGTDQLGREFSRKTLPPGTLLVPNRQPQARLLATMLEFDAQLPGDYLARERKSILRSGRSTIYDLTAWNSTMLYGLEALELSTALPAGAQPYPVQEPQPTTRAAAGEAVAWVIDGIDDASVAAAARLLERGVEVRVADRAFTWGESSFARGSVVVVPRDNRHRDHDLPALLAQVAGETGVMLASVDTGLGDGDIPDIGGGHFQRLVVPRIALMARDGISANDFGSIWHTIDQRLGIRHSHLDQSLLSFGDLRRYNVIVLPHRWYGQLAENDRRTLQRWVESGGTLIAIDGSAAELVEGESPLSAVRALPGPLDEIDPYRLTLARELQAKESALPATEAVWRRSVAPVAEFPWSDGPEFAAADELKRRDKWASMFMPQGAFVAARTDPEHWLTFGSEAVLPVLYGSSSTLVSAAGIETPVRVGALVPNPESQARAVGWSSVPKGHDLFVRMSGLLWPEAAARLANAALVTRERKGNGQVILFAVQPTFRGATRGTARLFLNALIYGPGFGSSPPIEP